MLSWQHLEVMQIGPAASSLTGEVGEDLRDDVYSWPSINSCRIDQETVYGRWADAGWSDAQYSNVYGLDAIEHLLFSGSESSCAADVDINTDGSWDALVTSGLMASRSQLAAVLVERLVSDGSALYATWSDSFSLELAQGTPYDAQIDALNEVFSALFYIEVVTKDLKLGLHLGAVECDESICPDDVEHLPSGVGVDAIAANLSGFQALFTGGAGEGFDDLLAELGEPELSESLLAEVAQAIETAESIDVPLAQAIAQNDPQAQALYEALKGVTDLLKGDIATVLMLQVPAESAGDLD
jgi:predicted lipoprotein